MSFTKLERLVSTITDEDTHFLKKFFISNKLFERLDN
jgi:hypothetical protein